MRTSSLLILLLVFGGGCSSGDDAPAAAKEVPAHVEAPRTEAELTTVKLSPEAVARLGHKMLGLIEPALPGEALMGAAEIALDTLFVEVNDRRDDVARALAPKLDDIFAEIGLDHLDAGGMQLGVELDLLRHHRLAFGDELGPRLLAEPNHDGAGVGRGLTRRPSRDRRAHVAGVRRL